MAIPNLNIASGSSISAALSNMRLSFNGRGAWLTAANNRYIVDTITKIKTDFQTGSINNPDIVNYLASSISIHCFNGWSYLSSSIRSLLEGDYGNAIHNAYYAELRGIMSILASQGIGVFNNTNIAIDSTGTACQISTAPTHTFAKNAFDQWLLDPANADSILKLITVENNTLKQWTDATAFPSSTYMPGHLASNWLQNWSLDLNTIKGEQKFRNYVSYNPQNFDLTHNRLSDNIKNRLEFVMELWKLCAPTNLFGHSTLRIAFEELYRTLFGYTTLAELDDYADWAPLFVSLGMNPGNAPSNHLRRFLKREIDPVDNIVFSYAKNINFSVPILESETEPMGIISRACLILLINTRIIESLLRQTGTTKNDLKFWFDNIGLKLGYWDAATEPFLFSDLWTDVELEMDEIINWINIPDNSFSPYKLKTELQTSTAHISQFNKAYMWGVGIQ